VPGAVEINVDKEVEIDKGKKNGKIERKNKGYSRHFAVLYNQEKLLYQTFFHPDKLKLKTSCSTIKATSKAV